jgi:hypothetical protein
VPYDIAMFAGAGLRFVGVDHEIMGRSPACLGMNDHLSTGRPAPPRPLSPEFLVSLMMTSRPFPRIALVPSHARRTRAPARRQSPRPSRLRTMRSLSASIADILPGNTEQSEELPSVLRGPASGFSAGGQHVISFRM